MNEYYVPGFTDYLNSTVSPAAMTATGTPDAAAPLSLSATLAQLDELQRGRYERPVAGQTASGLSTLDGVSGLQFITNKGRAASVKANRSGFVPLVEGAEYRLTNERKKQYGVAASGVGEEGLKSIYAAARNLSATQGKKADWVVEMKDPASGQWVKVADDDPKTSPLKVAGKIIGTALPIAVSVIPGLQFAGPVLSSALAGGAGAALAGRDPLKGAVMGGLSAAGGQVLGSALQSGGALGTNLAANAARALGTGLGATAGGLVTGQNLQNALLGGVTAGGLSYLGGELFKPGGPQTPEGLAADFDAEFSSPGGGAPGGGVISGGVSPSNLGVVGPDGITVTGLRSPTFTPAAGPNFGTFAPSFASGEQRLRDIQRDSSTDVNDEFIIDENGNLIRNPNAIVVTATRTPTTVPATGVNLGSLNLDPATQKAVEDYADKNLTEEQKKGLTAGDWIQLAGLALSGLGAITGSGGGGSGTSRIPGGLGGGLSSTFKAQLPAATMPGLTAATAGPRTPQELANQGLRSPQDYYRYGYGPEQSFFKGVPQGAPNTSTAFTGYETPFKGLERMAEGGYVGDEESIAAQELAALRDYEGEREYRRRPRFSTQHSFGGDDFSNYSLAVPVGDRAELLLNAFGRGLIPEEVLLGGSYDLGDGMRARASHMLGGGTDYGLSVPFLGGDLDIGASAPRGFVPKGVRALYSKRFEEGGYAVGGEGDGRDDKVPALLSDGEYVMDAETVAMLGNGSSKAGAKALDDFRVRIRKHKGANLSRGKFSHNAKKPEKYLKKGRA